MHLSFHCYHLLLFASAVSRQGQALCTPSDTPLRPGKLRAGAGAQQDIRQQTNRKPPSSAPEVVPSEDGTPPLPTFPPQPPDLRTGLCARQERERRAVVERHFSFGPLDAAAAAALGAELAEACNATLAQGLGLRNVLYQEKRATAAAGGVGRDAQLPPLDRLRRLAKRRSKLSAKLSSVLIEAVIEAHAASRAAGQGLTLEGVLGTRRLRSRRLSRQGIRAVKAAARRLAAEGPFLPAAEWACAHDLQGRPKHAEQRRGRAAERLAACRLRAAGLAFRTEAQLLAAVEGRQAGATTPDFVADEPPRGDGAGALRWLDVKHRYGTGDPDRVAARARRYRADWGPGAVLFTLGYAEEYAEALRARASDVWILDAEAGERLLRTESWW